MKTKKSEAIGKRIGNESKGSNGLVEHMKKHWWQYVLGTIGAAAAALLGFSLGSEPASDMPADYADIPETENTEN